MLEYPARVRDAVGLFQLQVVEMLEADMRSEGYLSSHENRVSWLPSSILRNPLHFFTGLSASLHSLRHVCVSQRWQKVPC